MPGRTRRPRAGLGGGPLSRRGARISPPIGPRDDRGDGPWRCHNHQPPPRREGRHLRDGMLLGARRNDARDAGRAGDRGGIHGSPGICGGQASEVRRRLLQSELGGGRPGDVRRRRTIVPGAAGVVLRGAGAAVRQPAVRFDDLSVRRGSGEGGRGVAPAGDDGGEGARKGRSSRGNDDDRAGVDLLRRRGVPSKVLGEMEGPSGGRRRAVCCRFGCAGAGSARERSGVGADGGEGREWNSNGGFRLCPLGAVV
mmetsp:Transcript_23329/g.68936  ORF Transcript_23329/g.68936 Transcript_23329/m.68936 type:complete len:254 (-) Transcript_23329:375-1136(-)